MTERRISIKLAAALAFVATMLAGCASSSSTDSTRQLTGEVLVGVNLELSGVDGVYGAVHLNALRIAADKINERGVEVGGEHRRLRLVIKDNQSDVAKAAEITRELVTVDHVTAIVGASTLQTAPAVMDVAEELHVPFVSLTAIPVTDLQYSFKVLPNSDVAAGVIVSKMAQLGVHKIAMLAGEGEYGNLVTQVVSGALHSGAVPGLELVKVERFTSDGANIEARVESLVEAKPEAIVLGALMPDAGMAIAALNDGGYKGKVFIDPSAGADEFLIGQTRIEAEGVYMVHPAVLDLQSIARTPALIAQQEFQKKYVQAHSTFSGLAPYAYDGLQLAARAIAEADSTERDQVRAALETVQYDGIAGNYAFSARNHGGMGPGTLALFRVHLGAWVIAD